MAAVCVSLRETTLTPYRVEVTAGDVDAFADAVGIGWADGEPAPDIFAARFTIVQPGGEVYDLVQSASDWNVAGLHQSQRYRFHRPGGVAPGTIVACTPQIAEVDDPGGGKVVVLVRTTCRDAATDRLLVTSEMTMNLRLIRRSGDQDG